jgi:hypothetical protein
MAIIDHPCFPQPDEKQQRLWRYMDFTKFVAMIATRTLYFRRSDLLEDPFEGTYTNANYKRMHYECSEKEIAIANSTLKWLRKMTYINCWHANPHESAAMWKLYGQINECIAIETDYPTLAEVLPDNVLLGKIKYRDYETVLIPEGDPYSSFMHKRRSFEHECEIRALIPTFHDLPEGKIDVNRDSSDGLEIHIEDLHHLIKCVHISPTAEKWFSETVERTITQFKFSFPVQRSKLYEKPFPLT